MARVLIAAGGTGGHVYPGLAVAAVLRAQGARVSWLGTSEGIEARVVPAAGIALDTLTITALRGWGVAGWLRLPWRLLRSVAQSLRVLRVRRPDVVLVLGGYVAGPGGIAAWASGRPLIVHEQNAVAGLTNRVLAYVARRVLAGLPGAFGARTGVLGTGNPVRAELTQLPAPRERLAGRAGRMRLLVMGGSQGALALNELLPAAVALLPPEDRPVLRHQAGRGRAVAVAAAYRERGVLNETVEVSEFIDDVAGAFGWADLAVCRAGAMTCAELTAAGLGAILIPYPFAADDHQRANAEWLGERGAAIVLPQAEASASHLAELLARFVQERRLCLGLAEAAHTLATPDAAESIAALCLQEAGGHA